MIAKQSHAAAPNRAPGARGAERMPSIKRGHAAASRLIQSALECGTGFPLLWNGGGYNLAPYPIILSCA